MNNLTCIIVDDEPLARGLLQNYCRFLPHLEVLATCENAFEAREMILTKKPDLIFLDINMPVLDGIGLVSTLKFLPQLIFTTAYKEYATTAFDLAACDYLVKPFSLERFIKAVDRATERIHQHPDKPASAEESIFIKADNKTYRITLDQLLYAEANGNYTKIILTDAELKPNIAFSAFEKLLPSNGSFLRVHRSFIINKSKIHHIEGNRILMINTHEVPIGSNYKDHFMKMLS